MADLATQATNQATPERAVLEQQLNLASFLDEEKLNEIAEYVSKGFEIDFTSRKNWEEQNKEYLKLALQIKEKKNFPWPEAANVKFPLLSLAALQFQARSYHSLFGTPVPVKGRVVGFDPTGEKRNKAQRISMHMSYQIMEEIPDWQEDMDRGLLVLAICGTMFKKTYLEGSTLRSDMLMPQDVVIDYYATSLETARRKTHIISLTENDVYTLVKRGYFMDHDYDEVNSPYSATELKSTQADLQAEKGHREPGQFASDDDVPMVFLECHCYYDLDGDDYEEPVIVTIHRDSRKVARISPRYVPQGVEQNDNGDVVSIEPIEYFTNYIFVPSPVSGVYGMGLGELLGPLNESANSIINQLIDSGTLNNLPSGFLAKSVRLPKSDVPLRPGEWRYVQATGDDLRKGIVPIPVGEPSPVLFNLLGMIVQSGQQLASITDTMLGDMPGQNTPYSTTSSVLEQGLKFFTSIHKRVYRAFHRELRKIYLFNKLSLPSEKYFQILDQNRQDQQAQVSQNDYNTDDTDVIPSADPDIISDIQKEQKAEYIFGLVQMGLVNPQEATLRILDAKGITEVDKLLQLPPPQPNFDQQIEMQKLELQKQQQQVDAQIDRFKAAAQAARDEAASILNMAKAQSEGSKVQLEQIKGQYELMMKQMDMKLQVLKTETELVKIEAKKQEMAMKEREAKTKKYNPEKKSLE